MQQQLNDQYPAKGRDATEILVNDHRAIKGILDELVTEMPPEQRTIKFEELKRILTIHNATEENLVYPALATVANDEGEALKLYHDTADADILVFELDAALRDGDDTTFHNKVGQLRTAVYEHIDNEEATAFPRLRGSVEADSAQTLTRSVKTFRASVTFRLPTDQT
jgi:hemerythrin superfamily protein